MKCNITQVPLRAFFIPLRFTSLFFRYPANESRRFFLNEIYVVAITWQICSFPPPPTPDQMSSRVIFWWQSIYLSPKKGKVLLYRNQDKNGIRKKLATLPKTWLLWSQISAALRGKRGPLPPQKRLASHPPLPAITRILKRTLLVLGKAVEQMWLCDSAPIRVGCCCHFNREPDITHWTGVILFFFRSLHSWRHLQRRSLVRAGQDLSLSSVAGCLGQHDLLCYLTHTDLLTYFCTSCNVQLVALPSNARAEFLSRHMSVSLFCQVLRHLPWALRMSAVYERTTASCDSQSKLPCAKPRLASWPYTEFHVYTSRDFMLLSTESLRDLATLGDSLGLFLGFLLGLLYFIKESFQVT